MHTDAAQQTGSQPRHRLVIVGGGFAGLNAARALRRDARVDVELIDRRNYHLFQPLLYQVATGGLSPGDIATPLRAVLRGAPNVRVRLGEVVDVDPTDRHVLVRDTHGEARVPYDSLLIATGATHSYFGKDQWAEPAPGLKSIEDATEIRARVLLAFEAAEQEQDEAAREAWLTFVVVGGGPTGVELAGALGELARHTMRREFRAIDPARARVLLVEQGDRVLSPYTPDLSAKAKRSLEQLGVTVLLGDGVVDIQDDHVLLGGKGGPPRRQPTRTVLWAAGVQASPLGKLLAARCGAQLDRAGRVHVGPDCAIPSCPDVYVAGDLAHYAWSKGAGSQGAPAQDQRPLPGVAPVAMQQGRYLGAAIAAKARGRAVGPFSYFDKGSMAVIGRNRAVAQMPGGRVRFAGFPAWLAWLFVHVMYLVGFENRVLVLIQWANHYFTRNRGARLITPGDAPAKLLPAPRAAAPERPAVPRGDGHAAHP